VVVVWRVVWVGLGVRRGESGEGRVERGEGRVDEGRGIGVAEEVIEGLWMRWLTGLHDLGSIKSYTDHAIINFEASRRFAYKSATPWQLFSIGATLHNRLDCHSSRVLEGGVDQVFSSTSYFLFLLYESGFGLINKHRHGR